MNGKEYEVCVGIHYIHKMDHRNGSYEKSQWTIDKKIERICFRDAYQSQWLGSNNDCWGLYIKDNQATYLGKTSIKTYKNESEQRELFIAKFIDGNMNNKWHGYPADPRKGKGDIPPGNIVKSWADANYIRQALVRKIVSGQVCKISK